jgi:hypothetical protein
MYVLLSLILSGCGRFSPERSSHVKITTSRGSSVYVKRLARGISYDEMWISSTSGNCRVPSDKDIRLHSLAGYPLYYKLQRDGSILLFLQGPATIPQGFPVSIEQEEVHPLDWKKVEARYASGEVQRVDLDLPSSDDCLVRW